MAAYDEFGIAPEQLSHAQAALLAVKIPSPENLDARRNPRLAQARRDQVLRLMRKHGWLTRPQLDEALRAPLGVVPEPAITAAGARTPHFVEYVKREALTLDQLGGTPESRRKQL